MSEQALQRAASPTVLEVFRRSAARTPDQPMLVYFDTTLSVRDVDAASEALAAALRADVQPGERVALYLQNVPQYVIALLATWKLNAIAAAMTGCSRPPRSRLRQPRTFGSCWRATPLNGCLRCRREQKTSR
jgi:long-chain acyl-CoA synthetase